MKEKIFRVLRLAPYPLFYFFCLLVFGYLTFPFDRMKDRILAEIAAQTKGKGAPVITMDRLDSYWLTGAEVEGLKIRLPADETPSANKGFGAYGMPAPKAEPEKDSVIVVKEAHARARLTSLLIGRVQLDFWASVFGGEVSGSAPAGSTKGDVSLKVEDVKLSEVEPLQNLLGIPIDGKVNGALSLSPVDGKFSKASGRIDLAIKNLVVSDGKTKIQGLLAIPAAKVEDFVLAGEADKGVLKISKLSAKGPDLELDGDGKVTLREPWGESSVDLYIKFRFTDAYRGKDATTKSILGEPGSSAPSLIEMQVSQLKKAKRADGFYGFHVFGKLKKLDFTPSPTDASGSGGAAAGGRKSPPGARPDSAGPAAPPFGGKRMGGVALPLGMSSAAPGREEKKEEKKEEKREDRADDRKMAAPSPVPPAVTAEPEPLIKVPGMEPQPPSQPPQPPPPPPGDNPGGQNGGQPPPPTDQPPPPPPQTPPTEEPR